MGWNSNFICLSQKRLGRRRMGPGLLGQYHALNAINMDKKKNIKKSIFSFADNAIGLLLPSV